MRQKFKIMINPNYVMIEACKKLIAVPKMKIFFFKPAVVTKNEQELITIYGCEMTLSGRVKVLDRYRMWIELHPEKVNMCYVLEALHRRLRGEKNVEIKL